MKNGDHLSTVIWALQLTFANKIFDLSRPSLRKGHNGKENDKLKPEKELHSNLQVDKLDGTWPLEKHGLLEGTALAETIPFIKAMGGDFTE